MSTREYVRTLTRQWGPVDEAVLDELTIQWRAGVNRALQGYGAAVLGDGITVAAPDINDSHARGGMSLDAPSRRTKIENLVYGTRLHPAMVASAKVMATPPALMIVQDIGVRR